MKTIPLLLCFLALSLFMDRPALAVPVTPRVQGDAEASVDAPGVPAHARHPHGGATNKKALAPNPARGRTPAISPLAKSTRIGKPVSAPAKMPTPELVHRPNPAPASVGGPTRTGAGNTAAINGTTIKRKP